MLVFDMAWNMSKDSLDMVWWAIVGSTEQAILGKVESRLSVLEEGSLQAHVSRLTHKQGGEVDRQQHQEQQQSTLRITYDKEYPFLSRIRLIKSITEHEIRFLTHKLQSFTRIVSALDCRS